MSIPGLHLPCTCLGSPVFSLISGGADQGKAMTTRGVVPPSRLERVPEIGMRWQECEGPEAVMDHASPRAEQILTLSRAAS